jgi:hypothetical protein
MNAVEIEEAVSELASAPFDADEFLFAFLSAFGNKATTVKRLRSSSSNSSDVQGGVLQRNNIHIAVCPEGRVGETLAALRASPKTAANKAKFILATDGRTLEAEDLNSGETVACPYPEFADHFGFFLSLAGISTVRAIKNNPIDIKATGRLNKLYVELLKDNPEWATDARRHDMNQFMAQLIFCFFAEDTGIFLNHLFTKSIEQMSDNQSGNTHEVIGELFRAMDTKIEDRETANLPRWADAFPYVNGGLFTGSSGCPRFSRIAHSYLLRAAELNWREINPDIFGSMIQAVADDEERGGLGMHYTSVPNILKVLNPLFLDDLHGQLEAAGDNSRKLRNLRKRLSTIRVFDPACGSGNFLVIAYIRMREIEHEIVQRTGDKPKSWIPLANFYGIEIKGFAAEIARLSLLIAEFQCDVRMINQQKARLNVLPLHRTGQIHIGNALRMNWLEVCPPLVNMERHATDLFGTEPAQNEINYEAKKIETYICGNPPYKGSSEQTKEQKSDLSIAFGDHEAAWKALDYVSGWFLKAAKFGLHAQAASAFVSTNSICQGQQVPLLWPLIFDCRREMFFAHCSFKWSNLAQNNAGVTVIVAGLRLRSGGPKRLFEHSDDGEVRMREVDNINPYIVPYRNVIVQKSSHPISGLPEMDYGSKPADGGNLILSGSDVQNLHLSDESKYLVKPYMGTSEFIDGNRRYCLWITDDDVPLALRNEKTRQRIDNVRSFRLKSSKLPTRAAENKPHAFVEIRHSNRNGTMPALIVPIHTGENRDFLPVGLLPGDTVVSNAACSMYQAPIWVVSLIGSRIHLVWIATICGKLETRYRYSNTLGWNTFPVPPLTEKNRAALTRCAEDILLAREAHFPATIAELYDPENMPDDLRIAHERNDETLERIYIGRRFRNDTERLEKLFDLYTKMTAGKAPAKQARKGAA